MASQPVVMVGPGPVAGLTLSPLANVAAGTAQLATVTLRDAFGNVATGYRGEVGFSSTDTSAVLPADYTFTAADAGVHTFASVALTAAGSWGVTAAEPAPGSLTDTATVSISPGPTTQIDARFLDVGAILFGGGAVVVGQTVRLNVGVTAMDRFDNITPAWNHPVHVRVSGLIDEDFVLENGRKTIGVDVLVGAEGVHLSVSPSLDPSLGLGFIDLFSAAIGMSAVTPDLPNVHLTAPTANPDGNLGGYMSLEIQGGSISVEVPSTIFDFDKATKNANGTTSVPFTTVTPGGASIVGIAVVTTPAIPTTGLVVGTSLSDLATASADIQVMGCVDLLYRTVPSGTGTAPPTTGCPATFAPVSTIPPGTPWIVFNPGGVQSQAAALVAVLDVRCADPTKLYNSITDTCD